MLVRESRTSSAKGAFGRHSGQLGSKSGSLIILLIIFVGLAAIIVWVADRTSGARRSTAIAVLNRRLASGEIDRAEYEERRRLIGA